MTAHANHIAGEWISGEDDVANTNPSNLSEVVGVYGRGNQQQARAAVSAATDAFPSWAATPIQERSDLLDRVGSTLLAHTEELGRLLSREEGKILRDGIAEVGRAGRIFKFFAGEALRLTGDIVPSVRPGVEVQITREPVGATAIITPWNFPIAIPAWKIAPALAYGNTVVFKPADLVPGTAWELAKIIVDAGVPKGVFNLVMGKGTIVGEELVSNPGVAAISFTGSADTGRHIAARAIRNMTKFQLEMGGKNPLVVLDDANLEIAVDCAIQGSFEQTGQRCTASSRLIVTEGIHDRFVAELIDRLGTMRVDGALSAIAAIGPVVSESQLNHDLEYLDIGQAEGAQLVFGGQRLERDTDGYFLSPALFVNATSKMRITREEIFGPVAAVIRVHDYEEALSVANDTPYGLTSGIVTTSLSHASHFRRFSNVGMVMVNLPTAGVDYHVPFGGRKASSYGPREQGTYAAEFFTTVKTAYIRP
jgi:aldehyde dehydrogenase (NAD+)